MPRSIGETEWEVGELTVNLLHYEPKVPLMILMDWDNEVVVFEVQLG